DDLSEIEMSFPKRMREQLVANLSLQVCMYEQCRDLLQPLTVHVPESGSELLLMSSFCSEKMNEFSRDAKRRRVSKSVRSVRARSARISVISHFHSSAFTFSRHRPTLEHQP
mgnify:CR=1